MMATAKTAIAEIVGGPHDGARIDDISIVELRAEQAERMGDVYVLSLLARRTAPGGRALIAYHPGAVGLMED